MENRGEKEEPESLQVVGLLQCVVSSRTLLPPPPSCDPPPAHRIEVLTTGGEGKEEGPRPRRHPPPPPHKGSFHQMSPSPPPWSKMDDVTPTPTQIPLPGLQGAPSHQTWICPFKFRDSEAKEKTLYAR